MNIILQMLLGWAIGGYLVFGAAIAASCVIGSPFTLYQSLVIGIYATLFWPRFLWQEYKAKPYEEYSTDRKP